MSTGAEPQKGQSMDIESLYWRLLKMDACEESLEWLEKYEGDDPAELAWEECERSDWMLWLVYELSIPAKDRDMAADFAERVLPIWEAWAKENAPEHFDAPRKAVEAVRSGGGAHAASRAAYAAAHAADRAACAARAARASAYAAASRASDAAYAAARVARVARAYAAHGTYADAYDAERKAQADIIRKYVTWEQVEDALLANIKK